MPNDSALINWGHLSRFASNLKDKFDGLDGDLTNVADGYKYVTDTIDGQYVASGGIITAYEGWSTSDYIPCENISKVTFKMPRGGRYIGFYDENKDPIKSINISTTNPTTLELEPGTAYWMVSEENSLIHRIAYTSTLSEYMKVMYDANIPKELTDLNDKINGVKSDLTDVTDGYTYVTDIIDGQYVASGGVVTEYEGWSTTDYIPCKNISKVTLKMPRSGRYIGLYDENKDPIKGILITSTNPTTITLDPGTAYWMVSEDNSYVNNISYTTTISEYMNEIYEGNIPKELSKDINTIKANIFNLGNITTGYYKQNGTDKVYASWSMTEYIPIDPKKGLSWKFFSNVHEISNGQIIKASGNGYLIFDYFTSGKTFISEQNYITHPNEIIVPDNAAYVVISTRTDIFTDGFFMLTNSKYIPSVYRSWSIGTEETRARHAEAVRSISRLGVRNNGTVPEQSIVAYKNAYNAGFRIMLCDLQFTSDNVPVCYHDASLNSYARNTDGTNITGTVTISGKTYNQLYTNYDLGIAYGSTYTGTKILKFEDMLKWAKNTGVELYVELKYLTFIQARIAVDLVKKYGMTNNVSWSSHFRTANNQRYQVGWISQLIPTARVALMTDGDGITETTGYKDALLTLKNGINRVFAFNWNTETLTDAEVTWMIDNDIEYEQGTLNTPSAITSYFNEGANYYCTGVESDAIVAHEALRNSALGN